MKPLRLRRRADKGAILLGIIGWIMAVVAGLRCFLEARPPA